MSLLAAIPGLSAHETAVAASTPPVQPARPAFDRERALWLVRDGVSLLNSYYPAGALEWLRENRPDVMRYLRDDLRSINAAVKAEDQAAVVKAVEVSIKHHRRAFEIYEARPPVVEVQGELL